MERIFPPHSSSVRKRFVEVIMVSTSRINVRCFCFQISKSNVVDDMVASNNILYKPDEHPDHCVVIKYVPYVGKYWSLEIVLSTEFLSLIHI